MSVIFIYVTCAEPDEAQRIAGALIEKKLVACANIFQPHQTVYRWQDQIESGDETAMILKTQDALFEDVSKAVRELHSYECPCIVALPVTGGYRPYLDWIGDQVA